MKRLTTLVYKGREFAVVDLGEDAQFGLRYGTIDYKYIRGGILIKPLNGIQMQVATSVEKAIASRKENIDFHEMKEQGMSIEEIFKIITGEVEK